jgi:hypothetical protein
VISNMFLLQYCGSVRVLSNMRRPKLRSSIPCMLYFLRISEVCQATLIFEKCRPEFKALFFLVLNNRAMNHRAKGPVTTSFYFETEACHTEIKVSVKVLVKLGCIVRPCYRCS